MKWLAKVAAFKVLSAIPGGSALYKWSQKHVTHSLDPTRERVGQKIDVALRYLDTLEREPGWRLADKTVVDFGSGWHPTIPLLFYCCGCDCQWLLDVVPVMDGELTGATVRTFLDIVNDPAWPHRARLVRTLAPLENPDGWVEYLRALGIRYMAPYMERLPELDGSVDVVVSTQALLHIDRPILAQCFGAIARCLRPAGHFLATVHLKDLYANLGSISRYNHLRYSPVVWRRLLSSPLMSFNRLKAPDYRELLTDAGFEIAVWEVEGGTAEGLADLDRVRIDRSFTRYAREDLAATHLYFAARKR
jgi:SAM-dependent methyltransferase